MARESAPGSPFWVVARYDWNYTDISRTRDKLMLFPIQRFPMSRMISRVWVSALDRYAQSDPD